MSKLLYNLTVGSHFDASHWLPKGPEKCQKFHGHRWEVEVSIVVVKEHNVIMNENGTGMIVDFGAIKGIINELDHSHLNEMWENPTAEVIATYLLHRISGLTEIMESHILVQVWESPNCSASVGGVDDT